MAYNQFKMAGLQKGADSASYDSDTELPEETQKKIKDQESLGRWQGASQTRSSAWEHAGAYPKLKKFFKGAMFRDKQEDND